MADIVTIPQSERDLNKIVFAVRQLGERTISAREILTANRTYYVATTGNDGNDGKTAASPFLTLQKGYDTITDSLDLAGKTATVSVANGTYGAGISFTKPWTGGGSVSIDGDLTVPRRTLISGTNLNCFNNIATLPGTLRIRGFGVATATSGAGVRNAGVGTITLGLMDFGACANYHMYVLGTGAAILANTARYTISGNAQYHYIADSLSQIQCVGARISLVGGLRTFSIFADAERVAALYTFVLSFPAISVNTAGTGYVVGDTLTASGGTATTQATFLVNTVNGSSGVTEAVMVTPGTYSVLPTNPITMTGGTGSGCKLAIDGSIVGTTWSNPSSSSVVGSRFNVGNNGDIFVAGAGANYFPGNSAGTTGTGGTYN